MVALRLTVLLVDTVALEVVATATHPPLAHLPGGKYSWSPDEATQIVSVLHIQQLLHGYDRICSRVKKQFIPSRSALSS